MVAAIALFATLVAFGNITDYGTNFAFVQHVLSMDTIFELSTIRYRAITSPTLHQLAYAHHHRDRSAHRGAVLDRRLCALAQAARRCARVQPRQDVRGRLA